MSPKQIDEELVRRGLARTEDERIAHFKEDVRLNPDKYDDYDGPNPEPTAEERAAKDADTPQWFKDMNAERDAIWDANKMFAPMERWEAEVSQRIEARGVQVDAEKPSADAQGPEG